MSFDWRLLEILADGDFHSGEDLGQQLGVSRAAIWKQLQKIDETLALKYESIKGRGYRLVGGIELLDRARLLSAIPADLFCSLHLVRQIDSTNRIALELARKGVARGCVVLAEQQSAGKGRRGRSWVSPFGRNIYCSIVWEFESGIAALEGLSLAVGVGVVRALGASGVNNVMLKWPNDVLHNGRKLAGILLEVAGDISGRCQVVIGVGINVAMTGLKDLVSIDQPWTDANTAAGKVISRNELASNLITQLLPLLTEFETEGFLKFHQDWSALDCTNGAPVTVHIGEQVLQGVGAGVDNTGALAVETELGLQWFHGGEVSLRASR